MVVLGYHSLQAQSYQFPKDSIINITPPGEGIVGNFGTSPPARHIHDQLHARSLALDDGESQLVIVLVDNVAIKREVFDEAKRLVHEATQLPREH